MTISKTQIILASVILIGVIGIIILIKVLFSGKGSSNDELYKLKLEMKDSAIAHYRSEISMSERLIEEKDKVNEALHGRDSILNIHYYEIETKLNESLRKKPVHINGSNANNDSLRIILAREF